MIGSSTNSNISTHDVAITYILKLTYSGFYVITLSDKFTWIWTALDHNGDVFHKIYFVFH